MKRKSFNINEQQLRRVTAAAKEAGITVNEFIRVALVEKIERQNDKSGALSLAELAAEILAEVRHQSEETASLTEERLALAVSAIERQQGAFIEKQQALLTQFLLTLGAQLQGRGMPSAGTSPKPIAPWDDPLGPSIPNK